MKVLIIQQKMIGDVLTTSILFEAIKEKYPNAELHYLINSHTYPVVENNPYIDKFIYFTPEIESSNIKFFQFLKKVRKIKYDIVIDVYSKLTSNLITLFSGAKKRISYHKNYTSILYNHRFNNSKTQQTKAGLAIENRLLLLQPLNISSKKLFKPKVYLNDLEIKKAGTFLENNNIFTDKPLFMISVLGSGLEKTYPKEYMAKIIDKIVSKTNAQILFNYIPKQEQEAKAIFNLCSTATQTKIHFNVFGKSLREFLAITHFCNALIGNEGGAVNMAKALDIPTFTIFSPWVKKETWSMFEDGKQNVSVHLKDYKANLFDNKVTKEIKPQWKELYILFKPELIMNSLTDFLNINLSSRS